MGEKFGRKVIKYLSSKTVKRATRSRTTVEPSSRLRKKTFIFIDPLKCGTFMFHETIIGTFMFHVNRKCNIYATISESNKKERTYMSIPNKIDEIIEDGEISIAELAMKIGVSRQQIARWRKGTSEPGARNLMELCKIYKVSADYILELPKNLKWPRYKEET